MTIYYLQGMCKKRIETWGADRYLNIDQCWVVERRYFQSVHLLCFFFCPECWICQIAASLEKNLLPRLSSSPPDIESLRLYLTLPECPLFSDQNNYVTITIPFAKSIISLKDAALKVLGRLNTFGSSILIYDTWWVDIFLNGQFS